MKKITIFLICLLGFGLVSAGIFSSTIIKEKDDLIQTSEDTFLVSNKIKDIEIKETDYTKKDKTDAKEKLKQDILKYGCADFWVNKEYGRLEIRFHEGGMICKSPCYWAERMIDENMMTIEEADKICKKE